MGGLTLIPRKAGRGGKGDGEGVRGATVCQDVVALDRLLVVCYCDTFCVGPPQTLAIYKGNV